MDWLKTNWKEAKTITTYLLFAFILLNFLAGFMSDFILAGLVFLFLGIITFVEYWWLFKGIVPKGEPWGYSLRGKILLGSAYLSWGFIALLFTALPKPKGLIIFFILWWLAAAVAAFLANKYNKQIE